MDKQKHCLEPAELMKKLKRGDHRPHPHLKECPACRELFDLLAQMFSKDQAHPEIPSFDAVQRAKMVPLLSPDRAEREPVLGTVRSDSWQSASPVALRDVALGFVRRLELKAGKITLELVAEKQREGWGFVARVYSQGNVAYDFVLKAGRRKLLPSTQGFYHWSSPQAPGRIQLLSDDDSLLFEGLRWS